MKKNIDGEKIALFIVIIIIFIVIGYILYNAFASNNTLKNNSSAQNNTTQNISNSNTETNLNNNNNNNDDTNNTTNSDIKEEMNITKPQKEELFATFSTSIYDKDENRVANITLANSKLNGIVIKKGEEFSFNNTIGPMDETQGFKKALGFDSNGKEIQIPGGGLCQISSTLYNAALIANLEITERHPHSRRVYYVPQDKDATIVYGSLDFKFKNNSGYDIKIESSNDSATVTINLIKLF